MKTSQSLILGNVYARKDLRTKFDIKDKTLDTGIFRPKGHDSIWIFVTRDKTSDMTPYRDEYNGEWLHWEGQTSGVKDSLIIRHHQQELELIVFYRQSKKEFPHAAFRYLGRFEYTSHESGHPTRFKLRSLDVLPENAVAAAGLT